MKISNGGGIILDCISYDHDGVAWVGTVVDPEVGGFARGLSVRDARRMVFAMVEAQRTAATGEFSMVVRSDREQLSEKALKTLRLKFEMLEVELTPVEFVVAREFNDMELNVLGEIFGHRGSAVGIACARYEIFDASNEDDTAFRDGGGFTKD